MESPDETQTSKNSDDSVNVDIKAKSAPILPLGPSEQLKPQISAPSYLFSLKDNDMPPFKIPEREAKPHLLIGTLVSEEDVIEFIAASDFDPIQGLKNYLGLYLVKKKIVQNYHLSEKKFLVSLLAEVIDYAAQRDFSASKLACLLTIYIYVHLYFKWYYWLPPTSLWSFFKEIMIRHTIEDSPDGQEVFEPDECYDIVTHFHTIYLSNLPLVHILTFDAYRLKLLWPFKPK